MGHDDGKSFLNSTLNGGSAYSTNNGLDSRNDQSYTAKHSRYTGSAQQTVLH